MKKYFIFAASALALAGCSSDDYLGSNPGNENGENTAINFAGATGKTTRAAKDHVGPEAANLLGKNFIVAGFKGEKSAENVAKTKVFDHYTVKYGQNTAGTTDDNTSDWHYVGEDPQNGLATISGKQTIKYWDYSTGQYDFIAFSTGSISGENIKTGDAIASGDTQVKVTAVNADNAKTAAYTIQGTTGALSKCYIADLVTAYNPKETGKPEYQDEITLTFRNLTAKARVAFYETIPGYSVKNVQFYTDGNSNKTKVLNETTATLFTTGDNAENKFYGGGTATVFFPTVGTSKLSDSDYNKAHVSVVGENPSTTLQFAGLTYTTSDDNRLEGSDYLSHQKSDPTYAGESPEAAYKTVLPNEQGTTLTLRVNYTLVSNDGSGEEINVYGAKAIIPAIYAKWKSNYAYTYIFKISNNTNGSTAVDGNTEGLYPITFDAVVADSEEGNQTTVTTVATPSITTYQVGHDNGKDEYVANKAIYVMAYGNDGLINDLNTDKSALYKVEGTTSANEGNVHDALTIDSKTEGGVTTGRNGIKLTKQTGLETTIKAIPDINGNTIEVTPGQAATFTPAEAGTYAFVYETTTGTPTEETYYTAITLTAGTALNGYFVDPDGKTEATGTAEAGKVYYQKIVNNKHTFAVKVIKVV